MEVGVGASADLRTAGNTMIHTIDIRNFRCFEHLRIENCSRANVIVRDNASGKPPSP